MMARIAACYLEDLHAAVGDQITERDLINELKLLIKFTGESLAAKGLTLAGLKLEDCLPVQSFKVTSHPKLARFFRQTFGWE